MIKHKCKKCMKNYKMLTKEGLCAYCFKEENGFWPGDFKGAKEKKKIKK